MKDEIQDPAHRVLSALRGAHNMLSVQQIVDATGLEREEVESHLVTLRLRGLAQCTGHPFERDRRVKVVTWKATPPDPM